jgi:ASC-1-like (ASCH) protein
MNFETLKKTHNIITTLINYFGCQLESLEELAKENPEYFKQCLKDIGLENVLVLENSLENKKTRNKDLIENTDTKKN